MRSNGGRAGIAAVLLWGLLGATACDRAGPADRPVIAVSIAPHKTLVKRLVGSSADVLVLLPAGSNPSVYEPDARRILQLARARVYFTAGVPFERAWIPRFRAANNALFVVDTNAGIPVTGDDPHTWLSPVLVERQVESMAEQLAQVLPAERARIQKRAGDLGNEIRALHAFIEGTLDPLRGRTFLVMHPSWNYFAHTYHLRMLSIEKEGREPGPAHLADVLGRARALGIRTVFAQPEYDQRPARVIAGELGGRVVNVSPLDEDWNGMLRKFTTVLAAELRKHPPSAAAK